MTDFSAIAARYEKNTLAIQKPAAEILLGLLGIREHEDVLDLGCGTGRLTRKIRNATSGRILGVDPSEGMIQEAQRKCRALDVAFDVKKAEIMDYRESFDVIVCNSALQWFQDPAIALKNCYRALRKHGRMGVQAPAKKLYSPNFIQAIEQVKRDSRTQNTFAHFRSPWFFFESAAEYRSFFEEAGFTVPFAKLETIETLHTPEEAFGIFESGAAAGYLNQDYYPVPIDRGYIANFRQIVQDAFCGQANADGMVELTFHRIYLVGTKE